MNSFISAVIAAGLVLCASVQAASVVAPAVDTSALPALQPGWAEVNPYRGLPAAITVGQSAFHQACARCHGQGADGSRAPAPDLRRVGGFCQRVRDPALHQRCDADADQFFLKSVLKGKNKFGIEHMPAWEGVLEPSVVWSIRSYIERAGRP